MAKSRSFNGLRRGSTKTYTFSVLKGQQITKDRVIDISNPRTTRQTLHRSLFANVVKFYKHGQQNFFKFAFEDRKPLESDYNAFVRNNINVATRISKEASASNLYPAIAAWKLTAGSLVGLDLNRVDGSRFIFDMKGGGSNVVTWSGLQRVLSENYGLADGDIITFVHILAPGATVSNLPSINVPTGLQQSSWQLTQLEMGVATESDALPGFLHVDDNILVADFNNPTTNSYAQGFAVIFSRKSPGGLKVSSSTLVPNGVAQTIIDASEDSAYMAGVLSSWGNEGEAILEGSLVEKPVVGPLNPGIFVSSYPSLPTNVLSLTLTLSENTDSEASPAEGKIIGKVKIGDSISPIRVLNAGSSIEAEFDDEGTQAVINFERGQNTALLVRTVRQNVTPITEISIDPIH